MDLGEAAEEILKYILIQCEVDYYSSASYQLYTKKEEIYRGKQLLVTDGNLAKLVDAYNVILYGKKWVKN